MSGLLQLEILREQQQRSHHQHQHFQQLDQRYKDRDVQNARLVGLLGRDDHLEIISYVHLYQFHIDLQDTRLVRLQRPHHDNFIILYGYKHTICRPSALHHHNLNITNQH